MRTAIPVIGRPLCASVASQPVPLARRVRWALLSVVAIAALVAAWPGVWLGVAALLLPDLVLLIPGAWAEQGRLRSWAVPYYNAAHLLAGPLLVLGAGAVLGAETVVGVGAGWLVHVCVDRAAGYDLRDATGGLRR